MIKKFMVELPDKTESGKELMANKLVNRLGDCDITWLHDGTAIVSTERALGIIKTTIKDYKLIPMELTHPEIRHRVNPQGIEPTHTKLNKSELETSRSNNGA